MINFLHNFLPQPISLHFWFITIYWYGIFIVSGILAAIFITIQLAKKIKIKSDDVFDLGFYVVIAGVIGARLYAIFLDWPYYLNNPGEMIAVWHGGLAIHGAILGGVLAALFYCWYYDKSFWLWADLAVPGLALAQAIGRWGNYFNQEVFGLPTNLPWGIPIEINNRPLEYLSNQYFQPTFLYESLLNILNFLILYFIFRKIYFLKDSKKKSGLVFLIYLMIYSLIRLSMENLRIDQTLEIYGWRWPVIISYFLFLFSAIAIYFKFYKFKK